MLLVIMCSSYILAAISGLEEEFVRLSQACCNGPDCGSLECAHMGLNLSEFAVGKLKWPQELFVFDNQHVSPETARTNYECSTNSVNDIPLLKSLLDFSRSYWQCQ